MTGGVVEHAKHDLGNVVYLADIPKAFLAILISRTQAFLRIYQSFIRH